MIPPLMVPCCHTTPTPNPESGTSLSRLDLHVPILIPSRWEVVGQFGTFLLDGNLLPKHSRTELAAQRLLLVQAEVRLQVPNRKSF